MSATAAPGEVVVDVPDYEGLPRLAERVASVARGVPGLVQVSASSSDKQPELQVLVDRTRASQIGLTPDDVLSQAYYATNGGLTNEYFNPENLRHDTILVRYTGEDRASTADLSRVQIVGKTGSVVPLTAVAQVARAGDVRLRQGQPHHPEPRPEYGCQHRNPGQPPAGRYCQRSCDFTIDQRQAPGRLQKERRAQTPYQQPELGRWSRGISQ